VRTALVSFSVRYTAAPQEGRAMLQCQIHGPRFGHGAPGLARAGAWRNIKRLARALRARSCARPQRRRVARYPTIRSLNCRPSTARGRHTWPSGRMLLFPSASCASCKERRGGITPIILRSLIVTLYSGIAPKATNYSFIIFRCSLQRKRQRLTPRLLNPARPRGTTRVIQLHNPRISGT
jgi:hypothetical protein